MGTYKITPTRSYPPPERLRLLNNFLVPAPQNSAKCLAHYSVYAAAASGQRNRLSRGRSLPHPFPRPSSSRMPVPPTPGMTTATADSPLFMRIPAEIRRRILIEAFGERPMHFDLRLEHPPSLSKAHPPPPKYDRARAPDNPRPGTMRITRSGRTNPSLTSGSGATACAMLC
jgi:hypothetical protein